MEPTSGFMDTKEGIAMADLAKIPEPQQKSIMTKLSKNKRTERSSIASNPIAESYLTRRMVNDHVKVELLGCLAVVNTGWTRNVHSFAGLCRREAAICEDGSLSGTIISKFATHEGTTLLAQLFLLIRDRPIHPCTIS
ncbi:MAG: hypothetical protein J3Q66DRAFT_385191 [Benniella sp.]|nr:MAG: hypothetical protein J3Q66DRAFT_385191 [Benniella sp.]